MQTSLALYIKSFGTNSAVDQLRNAFHAEQKAKIDSGKGRAGEVGKGDDPGGKAAVNGTDLSYHGSRGLDTHNATDPGIGIVRTIDVGTNCGAGVGTARCRRRHG